MKKTKKVFSLLLAVLILAVSAPVVFAEDAQFSASGLPEVRITLTDGLTLDQINSGSKETKYKGNTVTLVSADGTEDTFLDVEVKGRGNYTWVVSSMIKKPYQIKFSSKENVFGMGKAKKWVLLANYADATLMRNKLVFDLAKAIGMPYTPESLWVDVFVNDEYIGNYLLCGKNEIGEARVNLEDENGVLCEIDRSIDPTTLCFTTAIDATIVTLSDSVADDLDTENSVSAAAFQNVCEKLNRLEALLYSDNAEWDEIADMIDVDSFINYYYIEELTEDPDGCRSSFYLYVDGEEDVIHLGPVWDYDSAMGAYAVEKLGGNTQVDYSINIQKYMGKSSVDWFHRLFMHEEFKNLALEAYKNRIKPVFDSIPARISAYLEDEAFNASVENNFQRWDGVLGKESFLYGGYGHPYGETYAEEVSYLSQWLAERTAYLNSKIVTEDDDPEQGQTDPDELDPEQDQTDPDQQ